MKARVNTFLNIRTGVPEILPHNNTGEKYFSPGDIVDIAEILGGQLYKGNSIWYKLQDGSFIWSGGVDHNVEAGSDLISYSNAEIAKLAAEQNQKYLKTKFPNILSISDTVDDLDSTESHVIAIYLEDDNSNGLPDKLEVKMPDGSSKIIATEIVKNVGNGVVNINQQDSITNGNANGSVCCIVNTSDSFKVVTAGHVFSRGEYIDYEGELDLEDPVPAQINSIKVGNWFFQKIDSTNDVALAGIDDFIIDNTCISFSDKKHYIVKDKDVRKTKVNVVSSISNPRERTAFILDYNTVWGILYNDKKVIKANVIVIGSDPNRKKSVSVSKPGDSGGCVYEPISGDLVGLILGGNSKFTWVLSLKEIFEEFNYTLS